MAIADDYVFEEEPQVRVSKTSKLSNLRNMCRKETSYETLMSYHHRVIKLSASIVLYIGILYQLTLEGHPVYWDVSRENIVTYVPCSLHSSHTLEWPHFFHCSLLQVYPVRSLFWHRHVIVPLVLFFILGQIVTNYYPCVQIEQVDLIPLFILYRCNRVTIFCILGYMLYATLMDIDSFIPKPLKSNNRKI